MAVAGLTAGVEPEQPVARAVMAQATSRGTERFMGVLLIGCMTTNLTAGSVMTGTAMTALWHWVCGAGVWV